MQLDAFLKIETPKTDGKSTDKEHSDEIEIVSFEQTITRSSGGNQDSSAEKSHSKHRGITVIKPLDSTSPKLLQAACQGTVFGKISLFLCQSSGTSKTTSDRWKKIVYFEIVMEKVYISRMHLVGDPSLQHLGRSDEFPILSGAALEMGPLEELDLTYQKIQWLYKGSTGALNITGKWNLQTNSAT
ncbi:MAG: type VI secretion system tube protein Hcp [Planctomycetes bacterium]|nr:type VI secretion system tube protein Hcp [Planctomycetota bacterium]